MHGTTNGPTSVLHSFTKSLVSEAEARGVSVISVGTLDGMREGEDWGNSGNQQLHKRPFAKSIKMLTYKGRLKGIRVVDLNESYTSQACCQCNTINQASRVPRGLCVCKHCGDEMQADANGAVNSLKRYCPEQIGVSLSRGCLAQPAVNRFAWRNTRSSP